MSYYFIVQINHVDSFLCLFTSCLFVLSCKLIVLSLISLVSLAVITGQSQVLCTHIDGVAHRVTKSSSVVKSVMIP